MGNAKGKPIWAGTVSIVHDESCHWPITQDAVRTRAYFISLESGGQHPDQDWLRAEREFRAEAGQPLQPPGRWFAWGPSPTDAGSYG